MHCPVCHSAELAAERFADVMVERCGQCRGFWLDVGKLERLLRADLRRLVRDDRAAGRRREPRADGRVNCPRCKGTYLIRVNSRVRPGTIVDSCTVCHGVWLDAGEYARLARGGLIGRLRGLLGL